MEEWRNGRPRRTSTLGMQLWVGVSSRVIPGTITVLSDTRYLHGKEFDYQETERGEMLSWQAGKIRARYRLPGAPLAVGDFRGTGRDAVLVRLRSGNYVLLEPRDSFPPRAGAVGLLTEGGKALGTFPATWLSGGRIGVAVEAYQRLGLHVNARRGGRRAGIGVPDSDVSVTFSAGERRVRWDAAAVHRTIRYRFPLAQFVGGQLYVSARAIARFFPDLVLTRWDETEQRLFLKRSKELARILSMHERQWREPR